MGDIYVKDIVRLCGGEVFGNDWEFVLKNFSIDSRKIKKGDVFVAIVGEVFDGNDFYKEAYESGAGCLILSRKPSEELLGCVVVVVEDTIKCLQELARYKRSLYDIPVIAVTGSVGKTSTKDIIYSVVSKKFKTHRTIGNYNNHLGVPLTILGLDDEEALVVEMGMNHLGEISVLSDIAKPTVAVITNVGTAHIGNLGSRENILKAKLEILDGIVGDVFIYNRDNDLLKDFVGDKKYLLGNIKALGYSIDSESDWQAINLEEDVFSSRFDILKKVQGISVNVGGRAFVYNSLVAYAVGEVLGISDDLIKKGIFEFKLSSNRLERKVNEKGVTLIDDTYNANYDSMKSSIELLGKVNGKRRIAILGDMLELGDYSQKLHTDLGDVIWKSKIDELVLVGDDAKYIGLRACELGFDRDKVCYFNKGSDISVDFIENFGFSDVVLVKASRGMRLDLVVDFFMKN